MVCVSGGGQLAFIPSRAREKPTQDGAHGPRGPETQVIGPERGWPDVGEAASVNDFLVPQADIARPCCLVRPASGPHGEATLLAAGQEASQGSHPQ